jgi:hypothetical protein
MKTTYTYITRVHLIKCHDAYLAEYGVSHGTGVMGHIIDSMFWENRESFELEEFKRYFGTWTLDFVYAGSDLI